MASKLRTSASMLARVLRETFGERPEPWSFLEEQAADGVTVTVAAEPDAAAPRRAAGGGRAEPGEPSRKVRITANPETQLKKLPGLELVSEALSAIAAGSTSRDEDSDADLAIPRAPVLPKPGAADDDASDGVMHVLEDQPTSRWNVIVPPELDLDDAEAAAHAAGNPPKAESVSVTTPRAGIDRSPMLGDVPAMMIPGSPPPPPGNLAGVVGRDAADDAAGVRFVRGAAVGARRAAGLARDRGSVRRLAGRVVGGERAGRELARRRLACARRRRCRSRARRRRCRCRRGPATARAARRRSCRLRRLRR